MAVKIAKKCGIFGVHRAICAITCVSSYHNGGSTVVFHLLQSVDGHLPLKARHTEYAVIDFLRYGAERWIGHNNVYVVTTERQECVLCRHLAVAEFAQIGKSGIVDVVHMDV
ncbi:unknown [Prevotella sp. CAG:873]|nr:unknown [Prevotella sp. CAG:873]